MSTHVYLAGRIAKSDWRYQVAPGLRQYAERAPWYPITTVRRDALYVGPFFLSDDYSLNDLDALAHVKQQCVQAIQACDVVYAWLDHPAAYGTIWEIGYATGLGKSVVIGVPEKTGKIPDLWFAWMGAEVIQAPNPIQGLWAALDARISPGRSTPVDVIQEAT